MSRQSKHQASLGALVCIAGLLVGGSLFSGKPASTEFFQLPLHRPVSRVESAGSIQADERGPLFVGWEQPQAALFISGQQQGYIEPCGCTGLANQKGGLMRRHTLQKSLLAQGWNLVNVDAGNQISRFGVQANIKLATTYECLCQTMNYHAVAFGPDDLRVPSIELIQIMGNYGGDNRPFVAANVTVFDPEFTHRFRILEMNGLKIGMTAILGDDEIARLPKTDDIQTLRVNEALQQVVPALRAANCDFLVLVAHTSLEESSKLARAFPYFDLLITAGGSGEPTLMPEEIRASDGAHVTRMVQVGTKGMHVGVVGLFADAQTPIRYQRIPLDDRFLDSEEIKDKFLSYQNQLKSLDLDGLHLKPIRHPTGREFVGSQVCNDCHSTAYDIWKDGVDGEGGEVGPHWRATLDLTEPGERTWVKRHFDPECLSCHVTGWNPQQFFPYETGYLKLDDELMHGNGCENCHGPGSRHVAIENGDIDATAEEQQGALLEMRLTLQQARDEKCMDCHDLDNSPDFHEAGAFEKYWEKIKHYESD